MFNQIKNVEVYGLSQSVIASGYPMRVGEPPTLHEDGPYPDYKKSKVRADKLGSVKSGTGHDNFIKGIVVQFDMKFSQTLHRQILRYHFLDIVSSQSIMHRVTTGELTFNDYVSRGARDEVKFLLEVYNSQPTKENWLRLAYSMPMGTEMWARFTTNYLQLKTVYHQRRTHKLPEWRGICEWIETLPHFKTMVLGEEN